MHLYCLVFLYFVTLTQARVKNCNYFAPHGPNTVGGQCELFPGYPQTLGSPESTRVTVIHRTNWKGTGGKESLTAPVLQDALSKSIDYYNKIATVPPQIIVILTNKKDEEDAYMATVYPLEQGSSHKPKPPCQITSFRAWTESVNTNAPQAMQTLAHELYHCVQGWADIGIREQGMDWIVEGSADYFSNLVYPSINDEWGYKYYPLKPIYEQTYASSIFFQALGQKWTPLQISDWVLSTKPTEDKAKEKARLSNLAGFTDDFLFFAKLFSLKKIQDTSGVIIPNLQNVVTTHVPLKLDASGKVGTAILETVPFTVKVFEISVDHGQTVLISATGNSHQRLAYRRPSDEAWTDMRNSPGKGPRPSHVIKCKEDSDSDTILILFISTANAGHSKATITITHLSSDPKCSCKNSHGARRRALQSCQASSSGGFIHWPLFNTNTSGDYCPKGTHIGALAVWCCPDGTELDATTSVHVLVCCPTSADCAKDIVPNNMRCADPSWVLWGRHDRDIGCCDKGFVPNAERLCVEGSTPAPLWTMIPQTSVATPIPAVV